MRYALMLLLLASRGLAVTPTATPSCTNFGTSSPTGFSSAGNGTMVFKAITCSVPTSFQSVVVYTVGGYGKLWAGLYRDLSGTPRSVATISNVIYSSPGWNTMSLGAILWRQGNIG